MIKEDIKIKRSVDGITRRHQPMSRLNLDMGNQGQTLGVIGSWPITLAVIVVAVLINSVTLFSAF